jgi:hypothetical protein
MLIRFATEALTHLGIEHKVYSKGRTRKGQKYIWSVEVHKREALNQFAHLIGFQAPNKQTVLQNILLWINRIERSDHGWVKHDSLGRFCPTVERQSPDKDSLYRLYVQQGLSLQSVAQHFGFKDPQLVAKHLRSHGIAIRPRGPGLHNLNGRKTWFHAKRRL